MSLAGGFCRGAQSNEQFDAVIEKQIRLQYLLFLPADYAKKPTERWPMILFLHGSGERGDDLAKVKKHGLPKLVDEDPTFPFIVISPQCPEGQYWDADALHALTEAIIKKYRVDAGRLYLTGLSMGGYGTWNLAIKYPGLFAAIAPICGGGDHGQVHVLKDTPTWVFHGVTDPTVPIARSEEMVAALENAGGVVKFTRYENTGHQGAWTQAYADPELYRWFLSHQNAGRQTDRTIAVTSFDAGGRPGRRHP